MVRGVWARARGRQAGVASLCRPDPPVLLSSPWAGRQAGVCVAGQGVCVQGRQAVKFSVGGKGSGSAGRQRQAPCRQVGAGVG